MVRASVLAGVVRSKDERERERESIEVGIHNPGSSYITQLSTWTIHHTERKRDWSNDDRRGWRALSGKGRRERKGNGWITTIGESVWLMIEYNAIFIKLISLQPVYNAGMANLYGLGYTSTLRFFFTLPLDSWLWRLYDPRPWRSRISSHWIRPLLRAVLLAPFIITTKRPRFEHSMSSTMTLSKFENDFIRDRWIPSLFFPLKKRLSFLRHDGKIADSTEKEVAGIKIYLSFLSFLPPPPPLNVTCIN